MLPLRIATLAGLSALSLIAAVGCVSYATYPPEPNDTALHNPNNPAMESVMTAGLRYVAERYPPGGRPEPGAEAEPPTAPVLALNLPPGVTPRVYERIVQAVGTRAAPLTPETSHLPIYHITYMRVRGDQAQVNVLRPVTELPMTPAGTPVMQEIKLQLQGGLSPWRVVSSREWDPGQIEPPQLNYYQPAPPAASPRPSNSIDP